MDAKFPKSARLLRRGQYQEVSRKGQEFVGSFLRARLLPAGEAKLGLIVSRRFGDAVHRNRFKRLVRESYRLSVSNWPRCHVIVLPKASAREAQFSDILSDLNQLISQTALISTV